MSGSEKAGRLKAMLAQVGRDRVGALEMPGRDARVAALEGLAYSAAVEAPDSTQLATATAISKLKDDRDDELTPQEFDVLEAIVLPRERPVVFVTGQQGNPSRETYEVIEEPWTHLNVPEKHAIIDPVLGSVGRVEVPRLPWVPYGGTAFVVGPGLLMTNRHVAKLFCDGRGIRSLIYTTGDAAIDFQRRRDTPANQSVRLDVVSVVMIHPYWDMALLRVEGIPAAVKPLRLSIKEPESLRDEDIVAVGYPARDDRNDLELQDRIFQRQYNVKRLQPGKFRVRSQIRSFENVVPAMTHDASTLGGNSGSAVVSVSTGEVVGLHFAGLYLKANYAVPTYELARDSRVVAAGLNFTGSVAPTTAWDPAWVGLESMSAPTATGAGIGAAASTGPGTGGSAGAAALQTPASGATAVFTVPLQIAISFGAPQLAAGVSAPVAVGAAVTEAPRFQVPIIHDGLEHRTGYQSNYLDGLNIPLLPRTALGKQVTAKLDDGSDELKYHKFSVVMHKGRRLALLTGANVDWRSQSRLIDGKKPSRQQLTGIPEGTLEEWVTDWRISEDHQLPDIFFTKDRQSFDKGHVVRRDDVAWGSTFEDMQMANGDTYHTPNCTPQTSAFNQGSRGVDNWGDLETLIQQETKAEKAIVFGGPVLASNDPFFDGVTADGPIKVKIPRKFWKIVVVKDGQDAAAYGFVLKHDLSDVQMRVEEFTVPVTWQRFMEPIEEIEKLLKGLATMDQLKTFDRFGADESVRIQGQL